MACQVIRRIPVLFTLGLLWATLLACSQSSDKKPEYAAIPNKQEKAETQRLTAQTVVRFATAGQARAALAAEDDYTRQMSDFDRCLRLKTDRPVSREEFRKFAAASAMDWDPAAREKVSRAVDFICSASAVLKLPLPPEILLIETDGNEESGLAYTRGNAVIFPRQLLQGSSVPKYLVAHEIFHVLTRNNPELRNKLYATIGYMHVGEIDLPRDLRARMITNPDSPWTDTCCTVQWEGETITAAPILYSKKESYDVESGGGILDYLDAKLMLVEQSGGRWRARLVDGSPILLDYGDVEGLFEKTGKNTDYIMQPEEILADNFAFMIIARKNLPSPGVVQAINRLMLAGKSDSTD